MRKLLLSFFLILGSFAVTAQSAPAEAPNVADRTEAKTSILFSVTPPKEVPSNTLAIQLEVSGGGLASPILQTKTTERLVSFNITGLKPGTSYTVRARAIGCASATGCTLLGPWSTSIIATTVVDFPAKAIIQEENNCPAFVGINWTLAEGGPVTHISIKRSFDGINWNDAGGVLPHERSYYDTGVTPGMPMFFAVFTQNAIGETTPSNVIKVNVKPYVGPEAAGNLRSDAEAKTNSSIRVVWDNPEEDWGCKTNIRSYWSVLMKRAGEAEYKLVGVTYPQANHLDITGLNQNETVEIAVYPTSDRDIQGHWSFLTDKTYGVASKPQNLIGVSFKDPLGSATLGISWDHSGDDADYYVLEYSKDGNDYTHLGTVKTGVNVLNHLNISEGQQYTYRVKAGNYKYGESDYAYMDGYVSHDYTAVPVAPYGLKATWSGANVVLNWVDDSNKEEKYVIERAYKADGNFEVVGEVGRSVITYTDVIGTDTASAFVYRVKAENPLGTSEASEIAKIAKTAATGTAQNSTFAGINAYPNPTVDRVNITVPGQLIAENVVVNVFNQVNQLVFSKTYKKDTAIDVSLKKFTPGIYNVVVKSGDFQETKRIYKN